MMYRCKILTDEFLAKLEDYIQTSTSSIREIDERERKQEARRRAMYYMWNNPQAFVDKPGIQKYYESIGLWSPQYMVMTFVAAGRGFHIEPRIRWIGEVRKINDIKEIFSYESVE